MFGSAKKNKRKYKSQQTRKAASSRGTALAKANKAKALAQLKVKGAKAKYERAAKAWLKVPKGKKPKTTGLVTKKIGIGKARKVVKKNGKIVKVKLNPYFQFLSAMKDKGASHALAMYLWATHSPGTVYEKKKDDKKKKKPAKKKMSAAAIKTKAKTNANSKVKAGALQISIG